MLNRKITYTILSLLFALVSLMSGIIYSHSSEQLRVVFINVGQGDSILISQGSQQILIDGGKDGKLLLEKLGKYIPFWDRNIEMVIETHPDADHIGGLIEVFRAYEVDSVMKTKMQSQSQTFKTLEDLIVKENSSIIDAQKGEKIIFGNGAQTEVIFPFDSISDVNAKDTNAASVVVRLDFGENSFLFTGDLPSEQEKIFIENKINIKADVLKVGHHGSKYSSSGEFLDAVRPQDAIISVGKNNSYGHPNQEVLQRLLARKINILRTDEEGDIMYKCQNLSTKCQAINSN